MAGFFETLFGPGPRLLPGFYSASEGNGPETPSWDAIEMAPLWCLIDDVLAGHDTIKLRGERYLPRFEKESVANYKRRLMDAPWRPIFPAAIESLTARPFGKPVSVESTAETICPAMQLYGYDDVDGRGNNLSVFARTLFDNAVIYGVACFLVDFSRAIPRTDGQPLSIAEERAQGLRPHWVEIPAKNLLAVRTEFVGGREVYTHVRWRDYRCVADGFDESVVEQIKIYELDDLKRPHWSLWERPALQATFEKVDGGDLSISEIPFVLLRTGKPCGTFAVRPPMYDLAHVALEFYRSLARQTEILNMSGWPTLVGRGLTPEKGGGELTLGPSVVLYAPGDNADWKVIGPDAALVAEVSKTPGVVLDEFNRLAMQPTIPVANTTATASAIDHSRAHSAIEAWAGALKDALDRGLQFTAMWLGEPDVVTACVSTDFIADNANVDEARVLVEAHKAQALSAKTLRSEYKRRGLLSSDFDEDAEEEQLALETQGLEPEEPIDPITGRQFGVIAGGLGA